MRAVSRHHEIEFLVIEHFEPFFLDDLGEPLAEESALLEELSVHLIISIRHHKLKLVLVCDQDISPILFQLYSLDLPLSVCLVERKGQLAESDILLSMLNVEKTLV